ncbi:PD-(D/E)XK nuclease superfamily protein [bacterium A37T11]|nr:PD-(D/E)XK nuclease superfamily protein [bacterium A37T11]
MKEESFLKKVAADVWHRYGDNLRDIAIIFNNRRPIIFLRKHLADLSARPIWSPSFFTIQEFFSQTSANPEASHLTQFFILYHEHNELLKAEGRLTETIDEFYPLAEIILHDFAELDYELVNPAEVYAEIYDIASLQQQFPHLSPEQLRFMKLFWESFSASKQSAVQEKFLRLWARLPALYQRFRQQLAASNLSYTAGNYRDLATGYAAKRSIIDDYTKLVFVGFNALNRCESLLFSKWQDEGKALFYFDADPYYLDDERQEAGHFLRLNLHKYGLKNAMGHFPAYLAQKKQPIRIIETTGKVAQAKLLHTLLKPSVSQAASPASIAILLADESLLIPVLQSLPETPGGFNISMGYPLTQSALFGLLDLWLNVQQYLVANKGKAVYYRDVEVFLIHPFSNVPPAIQAQVRQQIKENEWLDVPVRHLSDISSVFPSFFDYSRSSWQIPQQLHRLLEGVLIGREQEGQLQHMEAALMLAVKKVINQLQQGIAGDTTLSPEFVILLLRKALQRITTPIEGEPLRGIQIMGLLESRCLDFDEIYILGVNEGILPKSNHASSYIPDNIRRAHGLPVMENQDALSAYLFYRLLQRSHQVTLVYNNQVDEQNTGEPSRFIRQLQFESSFTFKKTVQRQQVISADLPETLIIPKTGAIWQQLSQYLQPDHPKRPSISASAFTTYLQSPLLFFLKYIARIKEPPRLTEEFEMNKLGSVVHRAMQIAYEEMRTAGWIQSQQIRAKIKELPRICLQALNLELFNSSDKISQPSSMQQIMLRIAEEYAAVYLQYDANEIAPLRIIELENEKDYSTDFSINVGGQEKKVRLYGIIDRIDQVNDKIRIVDYKTGRDELRFHSLETLMAPETNKSNKALIQTLFYTHIYEQVSGLRYIEPNLYAARKLRGEGPIFYTGTGAKRKLVEREYLEEIKSAFSDFLKSTLEEIFNPAIPFRHNPSALMYENDPYMEFLKEGKGHLFEDKSGFESN